MPKKVEKSQTGGKTKSSLTSALPKKPTAKSATAKLSKQNDGQRIASLERAIVESNTQDLNPLVDLLAYLSPPSNTSKVLHASAYACQRTFSSLARSGKLTPAGTAGEGEAVKQVREWLRARLVEFAEKLAGLLRAQDASIRIMALKMLIELVHLDTDLQTKAKEGAFAFADAINKRFVSGLLQGPPLAPDTRSEFLTRHLTTSSNDLVRYYFLREAAALCNSAQGTQEVAENLLLMLEVYDLTLPAGASSATSAGKKKKSDVRDYQNSVMMQKAFQAAWQALLPRLKNEDQVKRVLAVFHRLVLPNLPKPNLFLDFMVYCCDMGGTVGLLALNGLFTLITKHNLDYPDFYMKLYGMLNRQVLHVRYRARFLRMLDLFLSSTHLPVNLVASFIKRLSRLSLNAPPAAIVSIVPFIYNLFKRHPQTVSLIHQPVDEETRNQMTTDPFLAEERDPLKTQAVDSSIWEIASLSNHYLASVSGLAKVFNQQLTKQGYDMEDFLDHTFASLFDTEMARKTKAAPALDLPPPKAKRVDFFPRQEPTDQQQLIWSDPITDLWTF